MLKKLLPAIVFLLLFAVSLSFALPKEHIAKQMQSKIDTAATILVDKEKSKKQKAEAIFPLFDTIFDYSLMAKLALGKNNWMSFDKYQQNAFSDAFLEYMKNSYIEKMDLYSGEPVIVKESKQINSKRIYLFTQIQGEKENFDIIYKFHKAQEDNWKIYDVDIIGVSLIQTYRAQFDDLLQNGGYDNLMKTLKEKTPI